MNAVSIKNSFSLSFFLHALFLALLFLVIQNGGPLEMKRTSSRVTYIEMDPLPALKPKAKEDSLQRVVQTALGKKSEIAAKNALQGERTQIVDRETVSSAPTLASEAVAQSKPIKAKAPAQSEKVKTRVAKVAPQIAPAVDHPFSLPTEFSKLGVAIPLTGIPPQAIEEEVTAPGAMNAQAAQEYVKGFKTGEKTILNTKEFVFFGYFQRVRQKLDRAWDKNLRDKLAKYFYRGRQLASEMDYNTKVLVTLDADGQIRKVQIIGQSGAMELDEAAVKAFNDAGPFPNPPKGLVENSGQIQVRWEFVLRT